MAAARFEEAVEGLPERHRTVLLRRYGLGEDKPATLAKLSGELGISKERVRQIQCEAEQMLRECEQAEFIRAVVA